MVVREQSVREVSEHDFIEGVGCTCFFLALYPNG
jgi:hypothetical protein